MKNLTAFFSLFAVSTTILSQNLNINQKNDEVSHFIDYSWNGEYWGTGKDTSYDYVLFNWYDYKSSWNDFKETYKKFKISGQVYSAVSGVGDYKFNFDNALYNTDSIIEEKKKSLKISVPYFQRHGYEYCVFILNIWKQKHTLYFNWETFYKSDSSAVLRVEIKSATFYNL